MYAIVCIVRLYRMSKSSNKKRIKQLANWLSNELRSGRGKNKLKVFKQKSYVQSKNDQQRRHKRN